MAVRLRRINWIRHDASVASPKTASSSCRGRVEPSNLHLRRIVPCRRAYAAFRLPLPLAATSWRPRCKILVKTHAELQPLQAFMPEHRSHLSPSSCCTAEPRPFWARLNFAHIPPSAAAPFRVITPASAFFLNHRSRIQPTAFWCFDRVLMCIFITTIFTMSIMPMYTATSGLVRVLPPQRRTQASRTRQLRRRVRPRAAAQRRLRRQVVGDVPKRVLLERLLGADVVHFRKADRCHRGSPALQFIRITHSPPLAARAPLSENSPRFCLGELRPVLKSSDVG